MPEDRKKGKHLTWEDRQEIQRGLREHRTFAEIALMIGCSPDTISKEIRNHRYHKTNKGLFLKPNRCKYRETCRKRNICGKKGFISVRSPADSALPATTGVRILRIIRAILRRSLHMSAMRVQNRGAVFLTSTCITQNMRTGSIRKSSGNPGEGST